SLSGGVSVHVRPPSVERSMCTRHPSCSVLDPDRMSPLASSIGLFFTGPITPSGNRSGVDHVRPSSVDVVTMPHHSEGEGPTLQKSMRGSEDGWNRAAFTVG